VRLSFGLFGPAAQGERKRCGSSPDRRNKSLRDHIHRGADQAATAGLISWDAETFQDDDAFVLRSGRKCSHGPGGASTYDGHIPDFSRSGRT